MKISQLLANLAERGIKISASGDQLQVQAPKGALVPELRESIAQHKSELLELLREGPLEARGEAQAPIVPCLADRHLPFPLTDIQKAYWLGRTGAFSVPTGIHVYREYDCIDLDIDRLRVAFRDVVTRHDMLRAHTLPDMLQVVEPDLIGDIEIVDLRGLHADECERRLLEMRESMSHRIYDTEKAPLYHLVAARIEDRKTRFIFSFDGINIDGGSFAILFKELVYFYENPGMLRPPLGLIYRDYVLALEAQKKTDSYKKSFEYWRNRIAELAPAPIFPLATDPMNLSRVAFAHIEKQLDPNTWEKLKARTRHAGLTTAIVFITAYAEAISRFSSNPRFTLNITLFNRLPVHPEVNEIIGDFSSMLLITVDTSTPISFEERALRVQTQLLEAIEHRQVSGVEVQREVARAWGEHRGGLFPVIFTSLQNQRTDGIDALNRLGNLNFAISQTPQLLLDHQLCERSGDAVLMCDAVQGVFPANFVQDLFEIYTTLLRKLADDDDCWKVTWLDLLPQAQQARRSVLNATDASSMPMELIHASFERQVDTFPNKPAVITTTRIFTYAEIDCLANQIAHDLRARGIGPDKLVPIVMEKGWEQVVAVFGVLKAGGAYVPLDAAGSEERLRGIIRDTGASVVLTQLKYRSEPWGKGIERIVVEDRPSQNDDRRRVPLQQGLDHLAFVLYTSGSTGEPKGAMIEHRGLTNRLWESATRFGLNANDRVLGLTGLHHDLSVFDIFGVLGIVGGALVLPDADKTRNPAHWVELIRANKVTLWNTVPAFMQMLVEYVDDRREFVEMLASLRWAILGGDFIPLDLPARIRTLIPDITLFSSGGPTETTLWNICYRIDDIDPSWKSIPYGRPMRATTYHILDDQLRERPDWVPGEMYIGGAGLARGYWRDEEKTRERFIKHPATGERLYKSGDLGRWLPDGNIEILGRADFQVKIRGYRIELGEIEAAIKAHPDIADAVVLALGEKALDKRLCAYVIRKVRERIGDEFASQIRSFLSHRLPEYMIPSGFIEVDAMPLTTNGKVDRKALLALGTAMVKPKSTEGGLPRNALEETLAKIAQEVIGISELRRDENFFEAGATSLQVIILSKRIRVALGREIPNTLLFQAPNISALAAALAVDEPQSAPKQKALDRAEARRNARGRR